MNKKEMIKIVKNQLADDMNCSVEELSQKGIFFHERVDNHKRRRFERQNPFLEVLTLGETTIVTCDKDILPKVIEVFSSRGREDIFAAPFLYGHTIAYLPDMENIRERPLPKGAELEFVKGDEIFNLYEYEGFENALQYDKYHERPDIIAVVCRIGGELAAVAGASDDCENMWQVGIDVLPKFRGLGLATALVSKLSLEIIQEGKVPYYCTASSNIPSQGVAFKSGFFPAWTSTYKNTFDGTSPYDNIMGKTLDGLKDTFDL